MNLYLLIDASPTLLFVTLWDKLLLGISDFVDDPEHDGIGVGFGYYGTSCDANDYATPKVPVAPLPDVASSIKAAFPAPFNGKASGAALAGSVSYARDVALADPDRDTAVVYMSDGLTDLLCGSSTGYVADRAGLGLLGHPVIKTYVVALGAGPTLLDPLNIVDLTPLDDVARAGGTSSATRIYVSVNAEAEIAAGLHRAVEGAMPCSYRMPADVNRALTKLEWADGTSAAPREWPIIDKAEDCATALAGYWPVWPSQYIELCPAACAAVHARPQGVMSLREDCEQPR